MSNFHRCLSTRFALLAAATAVACHGGAAAKPSTGSQSSPFAASLSARSHLPEHDDAEVQQAVTRELFKDEHFHPAKVKVTASEGAVQLTGRVDNALSKERATQITEAVRGVRSVGNYLLIDPPPRSDQDLQRDVQSALSYSAATAKLPVHASVSGAVVTLSGAVRSWQERQLAERIAEGVRGVRAAQNDLQSSSTSKREADTVARDVTSRLAWDALLERDPIAVAVVDDKVTLTGTVGSAAEKSRAIADARVDGVTSVDATAVTVKWWDQPDPNLRMTTIKSDAEIVRAIKDAAAYDPRVLSFDVEPTVRHGVVTLTGTVETLKAKLAAEALARNTVGVVAVLNQLSARSRSTLTDRLLQSRIEGALALDSLTDGKSIRVTVNAGEVTLAGSVGTNFDSAEALDTASRTAGVTGVRNELQVRDQAVPYVYSAWLDPYAPFVDAWSVISSRVVGTDLAIERRIEADFSWSPFIVPQDIQVHVENGKATLTGSAKTTRERRAASEAAIEAGAISVDNRVTLG